MDLVLRDIRYAARSLRRTPGFTAAAVITLTLGIGATTAIFAVVDAALLKPLPYPDADRMVVLALPEGGGQTGQIFLRVRESARLFEGIAAQSGATGWNLATRDIAVYVEGLLVSVHNVRPIVTELAVSRMNPMHREEFPRQDRGDVMLRESFCRMAVPACTRSA